MNSKIALLQLPLRLCRSSKIFGMPRFQRRRKSRKRMEKRIETGKQKERRKGKTNNQTEQRKGRQERKQERFGNKGRKK